MNIDVSVVMAIKNEQEHIEEALGSILAQENINMQVIVVDDHSDDNTYEIVKSIQDEDSRIRLLKNPRSGKVAAFNEGIRLSQSRFVCIFAGDDIMPEGSLAARFNVVKDLPEEVPGTGLFKIQTLSEDKRFDGHIVPRAKGKGNHSGQSPLMNRKFADKLFPVPESLPNEDTWLDIAFCHLTTITVKHSDVICCLWRMHDRNSYNMNLDFKDYKKRIEDRWEAYELFYDKFKSELTEENEHKLLERIKSNKHYSKGNIFGVLTSGIDFIEKLRIISSINPFFYNLRRRFFGIFSGW